MKYLSKSIISLANMSEIKRKGLLIPLEFLDLPFVVARIFWITDVPIKEIRGGHAHIKCKQFYICIEGCIGIKWNDGKDEGEYFIKKGQGVFIDAMLWTEETFMTGKDILLVLCSELYDKNDYIFSITDLKKI